MPKKCNQPGCEGSATEVIQMCVEHLKQYVEASVREGLQGFIGQSDTVELRQTITTEFPARYLTFKWDIAPQYTSVAVPFEQLKPRRTSWEHILGALDA